MAGQNKTKLISHKWCATRGVCVRVRVCVLCVCVCVRACGCERRNETHAQEPLCHLILLLFLRFRIVPARHKTGRMWE